jgi:hypothetical protein
LLWDVPPGLELILVQEGVAFQVMRDPHRLAFQGGRYVLFDSQRVSPGLVRARLSPDHIALDIDRVRRGEDVDPFEALVDHRSALVRWQVGGHALTERVARFPKAAIRARLIDRLRRAVTASGGLWARLAPFPFPFRAAFNFRADLDERDVDDYARFAHARRPLADCTTHFVSTSAYGQEPSVLADLLRYDTQSHGHYHVVYRDVEANRPNLRRAHDILSASGLGPIGFAAPHGRWNLGLDSVLEELGYQYSSEFQLGYDDMPYFPWRGDRFSRVLQVPIHPICEGLFFEDGAEHGSVVAEHLVAMVRAKIDAGEPAFVYGHPERRLARHPEILSAVADAIADESLLWRVTLTEFAAWWRWRLARRWSVVPRADGRYEVQLDDWSDEYPLGLEVRRGGHGGTIPLERPRTLLRLPDLAYETRNTRVDLPRPTILAPSATLRAALRKALDWETVTPIEELPTRSIPDRVKKGLRLWRAAKREREGVPR